MQNTSTPRQIHSSLESTVESVLYHLRGEEEGPEQSSHWRMQDLSGQREVGGGVEGLNLLHFNSLSIKLSE